MQDTNSIYGLLKESAEKYAGKTAVLYDTFAGSYEKLFRDVTNKAIHLLGPRTKGKTNIGCIYTGVKDGQERTVYIYNVCDHEECYREVGSQAISYTTGVPAMIGTALVALGVWDKRGAVNLEELDPDPFMDMLNQYGLPWVVEENPDIVE